MRFTLQENHPTMVLLEFIFHQWAQNIELKPSENYDVALFISNIHKHAQILKVYIVT